MDLGGSTTTLSTELTTSYLDSKLSIRGAIRQIWATLAVHSVVVIVGMTLGFSAILLPKLNAPTSDIIITKGDASWLASIITIIAPIGSLMAGPVMQTLGSRATIMVALVPYALGWILIVFSNGLTMLLVGRLITGLATTFGNTPCMVYITEISSPHLRPMLTATGPIGVSLGILLVYLFGWLFSWRIVAGIAVCFHLFSFAALCTVPESPVWLVSRGRKEDAHRALLWFHRVPAKGSLRQRERKITLEPVVEMKELEQGETPSKDEHEMEWAKRRIRAEAELRFLLAEHRRKESTLNNNKQSQADEVLLNNSKPESKATPEQKNSGFDTLHSLWLIVTLPTCYKPMIILFVLFLLQQFSGIYITLFYAVGVFEEMGGGALNAYLASVLVGLIRFLMSLVNIWLFRAFGRRTLCIFSAFGMAVTMLVSGTFLYTNELEDPANFSRVERRMVQSLPPYEAPVLPFNLTDLQQLNSTVHMPLHEHNTHSLDDRLSSLGVSNTRETTRWNQSLTTNVTTTPMPQMHSNQSKFSNAGANYIKTEMKFQGINESVRTNSSGRNDRDTLDSSSLLTDVDGHDEQSVKFSRQKKKSIIPAVCMLLYVCISMTGLLAIPWTLTAELFPTEVRSLANSLILSLVNFLLFASLQSYPHMLEAFGPHGVLWFFSAVSAFGIVFVYFFLPETRNKSLADIESYFAKNTIYPKFGRNS
ncbi:trehalose transporter 1-like protein isoform X2 [Hetaerina americana]|uniref:trehalose transporter 1-like protein isoform X2 n=1 Tax=Hetaerina americana TaxID=62018 RepID=UPI003A7F54A8